MFDDAAEVSPTTATPSRRELIVRFTGSGSEYFRIWVVNLLLLLVTLGLYWPFAKARRIRYFYANTQVDGQALSFHGDAWKMFRGFLLMVALFGAYSAASNYSPVLGLAAFIALALLWPPLWRAGMRFRLANTGWRGLRFGFDGGLTDAYAVFMPVVVPLALITLGPTLPENLGAALVGLGGLLFNLLLLWTFAQAKRYQHSHYRYASQHSRTWLTVGNVYGLSFRAGLLGSVAMIVAGIVAAIVGSAAGPGLMALGLPAMVLMYAVVFVWIRSSFAAQLQNALWSKTASEALRFRSDLDTTALFRLNLKNWILVLLTLGLYWPFAAVAMTRLRLEAVTLELDGDLDAWTAGEGLQPGHASGEIAGDFFGIDLGL